MRRLSDRAIVVTLGDYAWANQTVALASTRGLVVIDTQASRTAGRLVKAAIQRAFNRGDFAYVISTHQHYDHTNGNALYPGVPVVWRHWHRMGRWAGLWTLAFVAGGTILTLTR